MKNIYKLLLVGFMALMVLGCVQKNEPFNTKIMTNKSAKEILGNSKYLAMSYGGYRATDHGIEPTVDELKEDMKLVSAIGIGIVRTYKLHLPHASNLLKAINELKQEDATFEMYVMLGIWIDCKNSWTEFPLNHNEESERNAVEVEAAVDLANKYPDIVKVLAVGNEAMVTWQAGYFVEPWIILKWVSYLQDLKETKKLSKNLWITSSDNFASWGGGEDKYHTEVLNKLIHAVDYISMHTYPMHDTHYNPSFWGVLESESELTDIEKIDIAMLRARDYTISQYNSVANYMKNLGVNKPIHIGETGWATVSNGFYGADGSNATDEYKEAVFYNLIRVWSNKNGISCFYFEGFDEPWKDAQNPEGSENHFGLFTVDGKAKYALWNKVDEGVFDGLVRDGEPITKTFEGDKEALMNTVLAPLTKD
mgnify:CR=1 FL=1